MLRRAQILQLLQQVGVRSNHMYQYYIYAIEHTWCDVDPLGRSSFRWAAGTNAGPMSCRYLRGIHTARTAKSEGVGQDGKPI